MMNRSYFLILAMFLAACGGEQHDDIKKWMSEAGKDMKGRVPPLPEVKSFPIAAYEAGNLVSPFDATKIEPERKKAAGGGLQPDLKRRREPLESYSLETLKMVGTMANANSVIAIIRADRTVHHVRVGNYMGQDFGVITKIGESELTLKELVQDAGGDWTERTSTLQLQEK